MSVTILEALQNAEINLIQNRGLGFCGLLGKEQLHNAITLLEKGYGPYELVEPLLEKFGSIEDVPEKTEVEEKT